MSKVIFDDEKWCVFEELCDIQCTKQEICSVLRVTASALDARVKEHFDCEFQDIYKILSDGGKSSIRRDQMRMSKNNVQMSIWLGKQYLDQRDKQLDNPDIGKALGILNMLTGIKIQDDHANPVEKASNKHS
jgi:hypothetical protein